MTFFSDILGPQSFRPLSAIHTYRPGTETHTFEQWYSVLAVVVQAGCAEKKKKVIIIQQPAGKKLSQIHSQCEMSLKLERYPGEVHRLNYDAASCIAALFI